MEEYTGTMTSPTETPEHTPRTTPTFGRNKTEMGLLTAAPNYTVDRPGLCKPCDGSSRSGPGQSTTISVTAWKSQMVSSKASEGPRAVAESPFLGAIERHTSTVYGLGVVGVEHEGSSREVAFAVGTPLGRQSHSCRWMRHNAQPYLFS